MNGGLKASWTLGPGVWVNGERREVVLVEEGGVGVGVGVRIGCCCSSWSSSRRLGGVMVIHLFNRHT